MTNNRTNKARSAPHSSVLAHAFESLETRSMMAGDLHMHLPHFSPPSSHPPSNTPPYVHQTSSTPTVNLSLPVTTVTAPGVPIGLTGSAGDGRVTLSWTAPTSTGGAQHLNYAVRYSSDAGATWTTVNHQFDGSQAIVPFLNNGTSYTFEVAAINRAGQSAFSESSTSVIPVAVVITAPGAPTGLAAIAGDGKAVLSWTAPSSTGGAQHLTYAVRYSIDSGTTWTTVNFQFGGTHADVPFLSNGTAYVFEVAAMNRAGQGAFSDPSAAVTPAAGTASTGQQHHHHR